MEKIVSSYDVSLTINSILIIVLIAIVLSLLLFAFIKENKKLTKIAMILSLVTLIPICLSFVLSANFNNEMNNTIKEKYGLNVISISRNYNAFDLDNGKPSDKIMCTSENDDRVYETYLIKRDNEFKLYTRNEKGAYLPITGMSKNQLNK